MALTIVSSNGQAILLGDQVIELGGGANPLFQPNVDVRPCTNAEGKPTVAFTADFEKPLPIRSEEWDGVFSHFMIEHLSWRALPGFLQELWRILKPLGKAVLVTANTEAQLLWIQQHPEGWNGKSAFESASENLFGGQDYGENAHKCFLSPAIATALFQQAGFTNVTIYPYGETATDMIIEASRPECRSEAAAIDQRQAAVLAPVAQSGQEHLPDKQEVGDVAEVQVPLTSLAAPAPASLFDRHYFEGGGKVGGYAGEGYHDFPCHEITAQVLWNRKPASVLELGCARGYVLKRLQDRGLRVAGLEVSKHCHLTRAVDDIFTTDVCRERWPLAAASYDLCFSLAFLEHVPEERLPFLFGEMTRTCQRGLHGVDFGATDDGYDKTHCTLKPKSWWQERLPAGHEVLDKEEFERGVFPQDILVGDGRVKVNLGSGWWMYHHGWENLDHQDLAAYAQGNGYKFRKHDVRQGLPYMTSTVDALHLSHVLEYLTYGEAQALLRECRRVLRPAGVMRLACVDAKMLASFYVGSGGYLQGRERLGLEPFDEADGHCAAVATPLAKLWALVGGFDRRSTYDLDTLASLLQFSGFEFAPSFFRKTREGESHRQILRETLDQRAALSFFVDAWPRIA